MRSARVRALSCGRSCNGRAVVDEFSAESELWLLVE